ncbi:MAG TPA: MFS transporter, partial [Solirubrobacteraceae bacterium]|nr:MFS transporter [Solirubrobacteraceae bacterium]
QSQLGLSASQLGLVLLAAPIGVVSAMAAASRLLPRWGSRRAVQVSVLGYCLAGPLVAVAPSAAALFACLFVWGAFQATLDVAMNTQGIAVERSQDRRLMSGLHACWSLGAFAGAGIGAAAVAAGIPLDTQLLAMAAFIVLVVTLLSAAMLDDDDPAPQSPSPAPGPLRLLRSRSILALAAIAFAALLCEGAAADWSAVYMRREVHVSAGFAGLAYTVFAFAMVAVRLAGNRLLGRWSPDRLLAGLAAVATVGMAAALAVGGSGAALVGFACLGLGLGSIVPSMYSAAGRVPGTSVGAAVSTVAALSYCGFVCGPPLIGGLSGLVSVRGALVLLPVLTAAAAVLMARTRALRSPQPAAARDEVPRPARERRAALS